MGVIGNEEHKQRVNLSSLARSVIEIDQGVFNEGGSLSGFVNQIITNFRDKADASIDLATEERRNQLLASGYAEPIVQQLTEEYRHTLQQKVREYPQGDSLIFRLNNHNFEILYDQKAENTTYSAPSKYLKALLEEYARLSPSERERVYYAACIEQVLQPAMDAGYPVEMQLSGKPFRIRLHSIMADPFNSHLYVTGFARRLDKPAEPEAIASFRINRLANVKFRRQSGGRLNADERRQIEKQLQLVGVQYLVGTQDYIRVQLTPAGKRYFLQRSYMRPVPDCVEGDVYCFRCSPMQIRNYFLTFGKEAQVLSPASLRKEFQKIYREAARAYEESPV